MLDACERLDTHEMLGACEVLDAYERPDDFPAAEAEDYEMPDDFPAMEAEGTTYDIICAVHPQMERLSRFGLASVSMRFG